MDTHCEPKGKVFQTKARLNNEFQTQKRGITVSTSYACFKKKGDQRAAKPCNLRKFKSRQRIRGEVREFCLNGQTFFVNLELLTNRKSKFFCLER